MFGFAKRRSNEAIDAFSSEIARELARRYTPDMARRALDKKTERKLARALGGVVNRAREFREARRLGVFGKARLANTFKWTLKELGYDDRFVEDVTNAVVVGMGEKKGVAR